MAVRRRPKWSSQGNAMWPNQAPINIREQSLAFVICHLSSVIPNQTFCLHVSSSFGLCSVLSIGMWIMLYVSILLKYSLFVRIMIHTDYSDRKTWIWMWIWKLGRICQRWINDHYLLLIGTKADFVIIAKLTHQFQSDYL